MIVHCNDITCKFEKGGFCVRDDININIIEHRETDFNVCENYDWKEISQYGKTV